jgi:hypothetical protein
MDNSILVTFLSPILITLGGIISWLIKSKKESLQLAEQLSREKRLETYKKILDPYLTVLTPLATAEEKEEALRIIPSSKYKKTAFDLVTFGSDETVRCFNKLMQHAYINAGQEKNNTDILILFSDFILNIRKDLYSKKTKLKNYETLEFTVTDIKDHIDKFNNTKNKGE